MSDTKRQDDTKEVREAAVAYGWSVGIGASAIQDLIRKVDEGFSTKILDRFRALLGLSVDEAASLLGASSRTLARRQKEGQLQDVESDRLYRFVRLYERAVEVFDSEPDAKTWFKQPQWGLGGATPLDYARTEPGAREVEALLDRIDYGVMS